MQNVAKDMSKYIKITVHVTWNLLPSLATSVALIISFLNIEYLKIIVIKTLIRPTASLFSEMNKWCV